MEKMPKRKAISFDAIGDALYQVEKTKRREYNQDTLPWGLAFSRSWYEKLINEKDFSLAMEARIIRLKRSTQVNDVKQIVVTSAKIMTEARKVDKLRNYLVTQLQVSQTDFGDGNSS
jgi:hypothetical protein